MRYKTIISNLYDVVIERIFIPDCEISGREVAPVTHITVICPGKLVLKEWLCTTLAFCFGNPVGGATGLAYFHRLLLGNRSDLAALRVAVAER